jgi:hypothetical protein
MKEPGLPGRAKRMRNRYGGLLEKIGMPTTDLRVLELGAGKGATSYAILHGLQPTLHIATEPFTSLLPALRTRLDQWGAAEPRGLVAALDGNAEMALKPGSVNLIFSHGVLHHILDYKGCLRRCAALCDVPGAIMLTEPIRDGMAYMVTLIGVLIALFDLDYERSYLRHSDKSLSSARRLLRWFGDRASESLSDAGLKALYRARRSLGERIRHADDLAYLETLGARDKHMFAVSAMSRIAREIGFSFYYDFEPVNFTKFMCAKLKGWKVPESDIPKIETVLEDIVPEKMDDLYISQPIGTMCLYRI